MHIHHLALRTHDLHRLVSFYQELLGLTQVREQVGYSVWLRIGAGVMMIEKADRQEPAPDKDSLDLIAFAVDEAQRARLLKQLVDAGVSIEDKSEFTSYFRDPDGRRVAISTYGLPELDDA